MALTARRPGAAFAPSPALPGAALAGLGVVAVAADQGGVFTNDWRAGAVAFAAAAALLALWEPRVRWSARTLAVPALVAAYGLWSLASTAWSVEPSLSTLDVQRTLLYLAAAVAFALAGEGLTAGVLAGTTAIAVWALGGRLVNGVHYDYFEGKLLTGPIGYANGLGELMAIGAAVSFALALERRRPVWAAPLAALLPALALTNSRGAGAALAVGAAVAVALVHRRRDAAVAAVVLAGAALSVLLAATPAAAGDRAAYWHVARSVAAGHPLLGTGAGTFVADYARTPPAHDAHSLYLQALAELGVVGLLLVVALVGIPLGFALRRGLAAPAAGLAVFALHAGMDWDWQLPAVTIAGLALAVAATADAVGKPQSDSVRRADSAVPTAR